MFYTEIWRRKKCNILLVSASDIHSLLLEMTKMLEILTLTCQDRRNTIFEMNSTMTNISVQSHRQFDLVSIYRRYKKSEVLSKYSISQKHIDCPQGPQGSQSPDGSCKNFFELERPSAQSSMSFFKIISLHSTLYWSKKAHFKRKAELRIILEE